jgi:hypothetical protein
VRAVRVYLLPERKGCVPQGYLCVPLLVLPCILPVFDSISNIPGV